MTTPDENPGRVAATLAEAKRIADGLQFACRLPDKKPDFFACGGPAAEAYWEYFHPARIVSLLAAVEAALKLADELDAEAAGSLLEEISEVQRDCAAKIRAAIGAALTGTPVSDSAPAAAVRADEGPS